MSNPWEKMFNKDSLPAEVAEAVDRWERRAGLPAYIFRWGQSVLDRAFSDVENFTIGPSAYIETSRMRTQLRNEEIVVWVAQTIKEIEWLQGAHAAVSDLGLSLEQHRIEKLLFSDYGAKSNDNARDVAFSQAHHLWGVAEKTIQNIFDSKDYREARNQAQVPLDFGLT